MTGDTWTFKSRLRVYPRWMSYAPCDCVPWERKERSGIAGWRCRSDVPGVWSSSEERAQMARPGLKCHRPVLGASLGYHAVATRNRLEKGPVLAPAYRLPSLRCEFILFCRTVSPNTYSSENTPVANQNCTASTISPSTSNILTSKSLAIKHCHWSLGHLALQHTAARSLY